MATNAGVSGQSAVIEQYQMQPPSYNTHMNQYDMNQMHNTQYMTQMPQVSQMQPPQMQPPQYHNDNTSSQFLPQTAPTLPTNNGHVQSQQNQGQFDSIVDLMQQMNSRLLTIEQSCARVGFIEKDISHVKVDVNRLMNDMPAMSKRVDEMDKFCQSVSDISDDYYNFQSKAREEFHNIRSAESLFKHENEYLKHENANLKESVLELQCRSMQENLLFFGIAETTDGPENTEQLLRRFLKIQIEDNSQINPNNSIVIDDIQFDRVHRLGQRNIAKPHPRPIVAKFERYMHREVIRKAGIEINRSQGRQYGVREQFPYEIEQRRKTLYPVLRQQKMNKNNKVNLVRDKLYVNGKVYNPDFDNFETTRRRQPPYPVPHNPPQSMSAAHLHNTRPMDQRSREPMNYVASKSPNSTRAHTSDGTSRASHVSWETPNRFEALRGFDTECPSSGNSRERSLNRKQKAKSPLCDETAYKKVRDNIYTEMELATDWTMQAQREMDTADPALQIVPTPQENKNDDNTTPHVPRPHTTSSSVTNSECNIPSAPNTASSVTISERVVLNAPVTSVNVDNCTPVAPLSQVNNDSSTCPPSAPQASENNNNSIRAPGAPQPNVNTTSHNPPTAHAHVLSDVNSKTSSQPITVNEQPLSRSNQVSPPAMHSNSHGQ